MAAEAQRYVVTIELGGLIEDLDRASNLEDALDQLVMDYAVQVQVLAQTYVPVSTGELRASIEVRPIQGGAEISPDTVYEAYVEFGTGIHSEYPGAQRQPYIIEPKNPGGALRFMVQGEWVFAKRVVHPGIRAQPYMRPAAERVADALEDAVASYAIEVIQGSDETSVVPRG